MALRQPVVILADVLMLISLVLGSQAVSAEPKFHYWISVSRVSAEDATRACRGSDAAAMCGAPTGGCVTNYYGAIAMANIKSGAVFASTAGAPTAEEQPRTCLRPTSSPLVVGGPSPSAENGITAGKLGAGGVDLLMALTLDLFDPSSDHRSDSSIQATPPLGVWREPPVRSLTCARAIDWSRS